MKHAVRIVLFAFLLVALPLRGYAGVLMALCGGHHGGAAAAQEQVHEHGNDHHHDSPGESGSGPSHAASVCSVCASCCAGAGLAAELIREVVFQPPGTVRIPFLDHQVSGFVPEHLERPPFPL